MRRFALRAALGSHLFSLATIGATLSMSGCGQHASLSSASGADASVTGGDVRPASLAVLARGDAVLAERIAMRVPWVTDGDDLVAVAGPLHVKVRASEPPSLSITRGEGAATLRALDVAPQVVGSLEEGDAQLRWRELFVDTDALAFAAHGAATDAAEWVYLLRTPRAPTHFAFAIEASSSWLVGDGPSGAVVLRDHKGSIRARVSPFVVVDARGVRRELAAQRSGGRIDVTIDAGGLTYPLLLDPGFETAAWVTRSVTGGPPPHYGGGFVYDSARDRTVLFAGSSTYTTAAVYPSDTWEWDGSAWTARTDAPFPGTGVYSFQISSAYDSGRGVTVAFGGGVSGGSAVATLYEYDGTSWVTRTSSKAPGGRDLASMIYDTKDAVTLLFGGAVSTSGYGHAYNDLWAWDGGNWTNLVVDALPSVSDAGPIAPPPRYGGAFGYDPERGVAVLFGGESSYGSGPLLADTWEWNGSVWTEITPTQSPPPLVDARMVWDAGQSRLVMFGGSTTQGYVYDGATWSILNASGLSRRSQFGLAYDIKRKTMNVFGGNAAADDSQTKTPLGDFVQWQEQGCESSADCAGGACVGGYCCNTPCGGSCQTCAPAGVCATVRAGVMSPDPACPYLCDGSATSCPTACTTSASCGGGASCIGGACVALSPLGATCTNAEICASGLCVDGVCCNASCGGACEACDLPASLGTCARVTGNPHGGRAACAGSGACAGICDGASTTCSYPTAAVVCAPAGCAGTNATAEATCDGEGACKSSAPVACAPYGCAAGVCNARCSSDGDCAAGAYCASPSGDGGDGGVGTCVGASAKGALCANAGECQSGFCVDGVCCDAGCEGACHSCVAAGAIGTCTVAADGSADPRGSCASNPCAVDVCKGGACSFNDASIACGAGCSDGELSSGHCSGVDATCDVATAPCAFGLACNDATTCKVRCTVDADCVAGLACDAVTGVCDPAAIDGGGDAGSDAAADVSSDVGGEPDEGAVAASGIPSDGGVPIVSGDFERCTLPSECASGFCVDGVCCDNKCDEPCHSCALLGNPGVCSIEPTGVDLRNDCGLAGTCIGTCNGGGACTGAGPQTLCARNRCTGASTGVGAAFCPSAGASCPTASQVAFDCAPYVCDGAFGACKTTCISTDDCISGFVCDPSSKSCIAVPSSSAKSGGCSVASTRDGDDEGANGAAFAALIFAAATASRRGGRSQMRARRRRDTAG